MANNINITAMLMVAGGLAMASIPGTAHAYCCGGSAPSSASASTQGGGEAGGPSFNPAEEYKRGLTAFEAGKFGVAKAAFDRVLPYSGNKATLYYLAGASRMGLNDWKGARKMLEKSVAESPDVLLAQRDLGVTYAHLAETAKANEVLALMKGKLKDCGEGCETGPIQSAIDTIITAMGPTATAVAAN